MALAILILVHVVATSIYVYDLVDRLKAKNSVRFYNYRDADHVSINRACKRAWKRLIGFVLLQLANFYLLFLLGIFDR